MLWDAVQEFEIWQLRNRAVLSDSSADAHRLAEQRRSEGMEDQVARVLLANQAMWELVADRLGLTDADLLVKMQEIDQRDGQIDGRQTPRPRTCPQCEAAVPADRSTCQFCGAAAPGEPAAFTP